MFAMNILALFVYEWNGKPIWLLILYGIVMIFPFFIFLRKFKTLSKRITKLRTRIAIPSFFFFICNCVIAILFCMNQLDTSSKWYSFCEVAPFVFFVITLLMYQISLSKEQLLERDIISENSFDLMDSRARNSEKMGKVLNLDDSKDEKKEDKPELL